MRGRGPVAVVSELIGVGMLVFGIAGFRGADGSGQAFLVFWCLALVAIIGLNLWAASSTRGSIATIAPFGAEVEDDEDADRRRDPR
jgi:hypothetical protein